MLHLICDSILSIYCQSCYSVCKPDIDLVLDVHPVERPARAYRNTSRAPRGRCLDPHVQVFLLDEHLGQGRYPIHTKFHAAEPSGSEDEECEYFLCIFMV